MKFKVQERMVKIQKDVLSLIRNDRALRINYVEEPLRGRIDIQIIPYQKCQCKVSTQKVKSDLRNKI